MTAQGSMILRGLNTSGSANTSFAVQAQYFPCALNNEREWFFGLSRDTPLQIGPLTLNRYSDQVYNNNIN